MRSTLKHPAVHFLVAGAAIFAATRWIDLPATVLGAADPHLIVITAAQVEDLRSDEIARRGVLPSAAELDALVEAAAIEEMLYREALARQLDAGDAVVQRRLVQDMRFLSDEPDADDAALLRRAEALGLQAGDPVIRRRLIQKMRFALTHERGVDAPAEDAVRSFFESHRDSFVESPRVRLSHIFFSGPRALGAASITLAELAAADAGPGAAAERGEPFISGPVLPPFSERGLAKIFGAELARACMSLPTGRWAGPVPSAYGVHLVWIHERRSAAGQSFEAVRDRVRRRLEAERTAARLRAGIAELRKLYRVEVDEPRS